MSSLGKVTEEREFLRSLNETLLSNQKEFNSQLAAAQADLKEKEAQLVDLQEQVRRFCAGGRSSQVDTFTTKRYSLHWIDGVSQRRTPETRKPAKDTVFVRGWEQRQGQLGI